MRGALRENGIDHVALDNGPDRFVAASVDGYEVMFRNAANLNLFSAIAGYDAPAIVVGAPDFNVASDLTPIVNRDFPKIVRFASLDDDVDRNRYRDLGFRAWTPHTTPSGIEMAVDLLRHLEVDEARVSEWLKTVAERYDIADRSTDIVELVTAEAQAAA